MKIKLITGLKKKHIDKYVNENFNKKEHYLINYPEYSQPMHNLDRLKIADRIIKIAGSKNKEIWVTTFEELIFLRISRRIREHYHNRNKMPNIKGDDVIIYFIEKIKSRIIDKRIRLDENGDKIDPFPHEFFAESFYEYFSNNN